MRTVRNVWIVHCHEFVLLGLFVNVCTHLQIDENGTLAGIDAAAQDADCRQRTDIKAELVSQIGPQCLLVSCHVRLDANLILVNHCYG